jgi:rod shape-determining protein MreC
VRTLLDFIIRHSYIFLFILLETISLLLLFGYNDRQKAALFSSSNTVSGHVFEIQSNFKEYFGLKNENAKLADENARLQSEVFFLRDSLRINQEISVLSNSVVARVIDNSVRKDDNFITIDKGASDGLSKGMGVYDANGVVGIVMLTGKIYSVILPILNGRSSISCKIKGQNCFGFLEWKGGDPYTAEVLDLPYLTNVEVGDTIVTSGFSSVFPEGIPVGVVSGFEEYQAGYSIVVSVKLSADISNLGYVYINTKKSDTELLQLKQNIKEE